LWSFQDAAEGTPLQLTRVDSMSSLWKFKRVKAGGGKGLHPDPLNVTRPTPHSVSVAGQKVELTIPPGWLMTISAISVGECINLVRVTRMVRGVLEIQELVSSWDSINQAMAVRDSGTMSLAIQAVENPVVVVVECFHSGDKRKDDPVLLPARNDLNSKLRVVTTDRPKGMKSVPDHRTFWIFDDDSKSGSNSAIVIVQSTKKDVDSNDPDDEPGVSIVREYLWPALSCTYYVSLWIWALLVILIGGIVELARRLYLSYFCSRTD